MIRRDQHRTRRRDPESGQAIVEFAIVLFPLLLLVAGIIQFGIGINYWHDQNRLANQGARWAVVNAWPGCPPTCTGSNTLQAYLTQQALTQGLSDSVQVSICYPSGTSSVGSPIRVRLQSPFDFVPVVGIGTLTLRGEATMRIEKTPTNITGAAASC